MVRFSDDQFKRFIYIGVYLFTCLFRNGYHGGSPQVMGLTSMNTWRYKMPMGFGISQTMNPDPYRGPWGGKACRDSPVQVDHY